MQRVVPMYSFDNARLRNYSEQTVLDYEQLGEVYVRRKHGRILSARFRSLSATRAVVPCRGSALSGTHYTHLERIGNTKVIAHNPLPAKEAQKERERRLKLAAQRKFEARPKLVSDLPVELAA